MTSRPQPKRPLEKRLPLVLSLAGHALALAALWHFAPVELARPREEEPVSVRLVSAARAPQPQLQPVPQLDRRALPALADPEPVSFEACTEAPLDDEVSEPGLASACEVPASARRGTIGVGASGMLRVPHPAAHASSAAEAPCAATSEPQPLAAVSAPAEETVPPAPLVCPAPEYPAGSAGVSEYGRVRLALDIGSDGRVVAVRVLKSSGYVRLDQAAVDGVRGWRFEPARRAGRAIEWHLEHSIVFRVAGASG